MTPRAAWQEARLRRDHGTTLRLGHALLAADPGDLAVHRALARLSAEQGDATAARPHHAAVLAAAPDDLESAAHLVRGRMAGGLSLDAAIEAVRPGVAPPARERLARAVHDALDRPTVRKVPHVAIVGVSHCGSTILDRILGSLPGVRSIGESHWLTKARAGSSAHELTLATDLAAGPLVPCSICGAACRTLDEDFRVSLAGDRRDWYFRIAERLRAEVLVSSDKNAPKLLANDPLLRFSALLLFKSPEQAWRSHRRKLPADRPTGYYLEAAHDYARVWTEDYTRLLQGLRPTGAHVCLSFEAFAASPDPLLAALCAELDMPYDPAALSITRPGHAIGGNRGSLGHLRKRRFGVEITPLDEPAIDRREAAILRDYPQLDDLHSELLARHAALAEGSSRRIVKPARAARGTPLETLEAAALRLERDGAADDAAVLRQAAARLDPAALAALQARAERGAQSSDGRGPALPLDLVGGFETALARARLLRLAGRRPLRLLDLGSGSGYLQAVASLFGHEAIGVAPPVRAGNKGRPHRLAELAALLGSTRVPLMIAPLEPLPPLGRFNLIAGFDAGFAVLPDRRGWPIDTWRFFLADLRDHLLAPDGEVWLGLVERRLDRAAWDWLAARAAYFDGAGRILGFTTLKTI